MGLKKIATNIPEDLIEEAVLLSGFNQTQTLILGLRELISKKKREKFLQLAGKLHIRIDTNKTRNRQRT